MTNHEERVQTCRGAKRYALPCKRRAGSNGYCYQHASQWRPGDPCGQCGSTNTGESYIAGAYCNDCGASDADE